MESKRLLTMTFITGLVLILALIPFMGACAKPAPAPAPAPTVTVTAPAPAPSPTFTIRFSHESPATHVKGVWAEDFKKTVEERSNGQIQATLFHGGSLFSNPADSFFAMSQGVIEMAAASTGYVATMVPQFDVITLPFITPNKEGLYKFADSDVGKELLDLLETKGLKGLGYVANAPLELFSKTAIVSLEDYKGNKIRAHSAVVEDIVATLGASPMAMPASEVYLALEQGILDGALTTVGYAAPNSFWEVCDYVSLVGIVAVCYPVVINLEFFNSLPSNLQQVVETAVVDACNLNRENLDEAVKSSLETLKAGGIKVLELTPEQHQALVSKVASVYDKNKEAIGEDLIKRVQRLFSS